MLSDVGCVRREDQMRGCVLRGMASVSGVCCVLYVDVSCCTLYVSVWCLLYVVCCMLRVGVCCMLCVVC